jgi:hypothetical protein
MLLSARAFLLQGCNTTVTTAKGAEVRAAMEQRMFPFAVPA